MQVFVEYVCVCAQVCVCACVCVSVWWNEHILMSLYVFWDLTTWGTMNNVLFIITTNGNA